MLFTWCRSCDAKITDLKHYESNLCEDCTRKERDEEAESAPILRAARQAEVAERKKSLGLILPTARLSQWNVPALTSRDVMRYRIDDDVIDLTLGTSTIDTEDLPTWSSIYICGPVGTGKTVLACALLYKAFAEAYPEHPRRTYAYVSVPDLLGELRRTFNRSDKSVTEEDVIDKYREFHLLVLDDLGAEKVTDWTSMALFRVIDHRYQAGSVTIFTSNYTVEELGAMMGDHRIASRIGGWCKVFGIKRRDYRQE